MVTKFIDIEDTYGKLLKKEIPQFEIIHPSLITILKAYGETNLSNLLGYLFRGDHHLILKRIFLEALFEEFDLDFLPDHDFENYLSEIKVNIEYGTKFGRIDILIRRDHKTESKRWAIIIENKLFHTLNNDLDDYYFTVSSEFKILPKNVIVIILALRDIKLGLPNHIPHKVILHRSLKKNVLKLYSENLSQVNDRTASLIINEYLRHIDDIYLDSTSNTNNECFDLFFNNQLLINRFYNERSEWAFEDLSQKNQQYLFKFSHKADLLTALQDNVLKEMETSFDLFLSLNDRKVSGNSTVKYFRGTAASYDIIRYELNYQNFYKGYAPLKFKSWVNRLALKLLGLDQTNDNFISELAKVGAHYDSKSNSEWVLIFSEEHIPSNAQIFDVIKENLNENWLGLEGYLSQLYDDDKSQSFYNKARVVLEKMRYLIEEGEKSINYFPANWDFFLKCKLTFIAPDYIEIVLYVYIDYREHCFKILEADSLNKDFLVFNNRHASHISELRFDSAIGSVLNYEALAKRSFREPNLDKAILKLKNELSIFKELEKMLVKNFNNLNSYE